MNRPYMICHMVTSIDGKVTGDFLSRPSCEAAIEIYYEMNRAYKERGSGGFICGRVTMEGSFTGGWYPDLSEYRPIENRTDCWLDGELAHANYFAIAFDPKGRLGWRSNVIEDSDPGYGGARIIEVLTEQADSRYLAYLQEQKIPYFFAGKREIDVSHALKILLEHLAPTFYVLEGGSVINGYFLRADCVDEISLVQAPVTADGESASLFAEGAPCDFALVETKQQRGALVMRYKRQRKES